MMNSASFRSIVEPILNEEFDGVYDQRADEYKSVFSERNGIARSYHEEPVLYGFPAAPEVPDATPIPYMQGGVLFIQRYVYRVYGMAFALTRVLVEDGDHINLGSIFSRHLAQSMVETRETLAANIFNRSFNSSYKGGDQKSLVATDHPIANGASFSNQLTTAAALSQSSLEQLLTQIRQAQDNTGRKIRLTPKKLVVAPFNMFQAEVILKSVLRTGTMNNDINPIKSTGLLEGGVVVMSRLTSNTAFWITTDVPEGLKKLNRRKLSRASEGDFETDTMRYKATERYVFGWTDPRCVFGTPGL